MCRASAAHSVRRWTSNSALIAVIDFIVYAFAFKTNSTERTSSAWMLTFLE